MLADFAAHAHNPGVAAVAERFRTLSRVAVLGRPGVGRKAVAAALAASGVPLADDGADANVVVIAESLKPEERTEIADAPASMVVLNKADLTGADPGGPMVSAERRSARFATTLGLPVVPMIAHLATVELDTDDVAALRALVVTPADMTSTDAFCVSEHPLPTEVRGRLLARLDRFGLAHAVLAVADGATGPEVGRQLRALSGVDRVVEQLAAVGAPARYRRVCSTVRELRTLAAQSGDDRVDAFLSSDEVVIAVMAAAVEVVQASGFVVDRGDEVDAHVRRAVHWRRYERGPVDHLHQRCAADITRGSLRLLGRAR
ncbi:MAG: hypothetical protein WBB00_06370 [Mycobacterium sp.]